MILRDLCTALETWAPLAYQESYDNSRLIYGDPQNEIQQALVCLDVTEQVVDEAISKKADLIIAHHPIIFKGIKSLSPKNRRGAKPDKGHSD